MRVVLPWLAACALTLAANGAAAEQEAKPAKAAEDSPTDVKEAVVEAPVAGAPDDPVVCRREMPTGSRIAVKVCMKLSDRVAVATGAPKFGELQHVDGFDEKLAPKPSGAP